MIPVTVRLSNSSVDRHITGMLSGLSWRSVAPGGFASAAFSLQKPIDVNDPMLAAFTRVYIYDARSGEVLWEGRLQFSGRSADDQGQVWALTAIGPSAHTLDQAAPLIYIDWQLAGWERGYHEGGLMAQSATAGASTHPAVNDVDVVLCAYPPGVPFVSNSRSAAIYQELAGSGMELGVLAFSWDAGFASGTWSAEAVTGTAASPQLEIPFTVSVNTTGGSFLGAVIDDWPSGRDVASVRLRSGAAGTTAGDTTWASFASMRVLGRRMTQAGVLVSGFAGMGSSSIYVRASWVVGDLLGRMLPQYDGANAVLAGDTVNIDQLAYTDAVTPSQVLDDLMQLEPATYWAAWESNAAGKYRFEWVNWPTTARYEATVTDGFSSPAPAFEQYNRVKVRYKEPRGRTRTLARTQTITELDQAGIIREGFIDLADEAGSPSNALSTADSFLADHRAPISGGTLTIARPILDLETARAAAPWQIKPGELIRVRGIEASFQTTGTASRDGVTVFRIVSVEVDGEGVATLELDMFTRTEARSLAEVAKRRLRKR